MVYCCNKTLGLLHYNFSGSEVDGSQLVIMNEKLEEVLQEKQIITG